MSVTSLLLRGLLAGLLVAGSAAPPTSAAQTWSEPRSIPAPRTGEPNTLAVDRHGNAIVVWGARGLRQSPAELTVDVVRAAPAKRTRWQQGRSLILDSARSDAGDVDLLVQEGTRSPVRLALLHIRMDGSVRRVWSIGVRSATTNPALHAMVARRGSRLAVAWLASRSTRNFAPLHLRLATSDRGGRLRTHDVDGVLPQWVDNHLGLVHSTDLAIGTAGDPVIAITATRGRFRRALVLASMTLDGAVRTRQIVPGVQGLAGMRATPSGRIGVLVENTGIEGDVGECVNDPTPRKLSGFVRERGSRKFGPPQPLATPSISCDRRVDGRLLTGPGNRLAIVWGTAPEAPPELPSVQVAVADPGARFTAPATLATGLVLRSAAFDAQALNVAMIRPSSMFNLLFGPPFSQRFAPGAPGPLQALDETSAWLVLSDGDRSGVVATAWQRGTRRDLRLSFANG